MTRVNTLNEIADIYFAGKQIVEEKADNVVGKQSAGAELEDEKKASKQPAKGTGPEAAEHYDKKVNEAGGTGARDEKNQHSAGKTANESINNEDMSKKKSIFDKLYEEVLGGDDDELEMGAGFDAFGGDDEGGEDDEFGGEDEVTLTLPRDLAEKLHEVLMDQLDGGDEDIEDIEDTEDMEELDEYSSDEDEDEEVMQEAPEHQELGDAGPGGSDTDKGNLKGKNNKVGGKTGATSHGHGQGKLKGGKGEPSPLGDKVGTLTGKDNKVGGRVTGKDQDAFA
jgi:hypothetical protein